MTRQFLSLVDAPAEEGTKRKTALVTGVTLAVRPSEFLFRKHTASAHRAKAHFAWL